MTLSTTGAPSDGLVYITMLGQDTSGNSIIEQGSGILISDDEVLTAAHLVFNADGSLRTKGAAAVGYNNGQSIASTAINGVQANSPQDYTSIAGIGADFAVVHLAKPVTNGTVFQLGADLASGSFQISGYPVGTSGTLDTKTENLAVASGTEVYTGGSLHDGAGNPNGSSGGSIYQIVNGVPTAYGVISATLSSDNTQGLFKELTAADVAEINGWIAAADSGATPLATSITSAVTGSHSASGFNLDMATILDTDANSFRGGKQAAMTDVAAAITKACQNGGTFGDMVKDASNYLDSTSSNAKRDVAYLAGVLSGTTASWMSSIGRTANNLIGGSVFNTATKAFARTGRQEGIGMGISNTGAVIDQGSATLAGVIAGQGVAGDACQAYGTLDVNQHATLAAPRGASHTASLFG